MRWPIADSSLITVILALHGCGAPASPPPIAASSGQEPAKLSEDRAAPPTPAPSHSGGPPAALSAEASAPSSPGTAPARTDTRDAPPAPPPLTETEKKDMERTCKPLTQALNAAVQKAETVRRGAAKRTGTPNAAPDKPDAVEVLKQVLAKPPKMPAADRDRCATLLERSIREYEAAMIQTEARTVLEMLARRMMSATLESKKLCPSSPPVPPNAAAIATAPFISTSADWDAPGWRCLGFDFAGQTQRFQYEVVTVAAPPSFEVIARGIPMRDGSVVEFFQRGVVTSGKIELTPFTRR